MTNYKNQNGFTLIEILIAIGLLAVMVVSVSQLTDGILASQNISESRNDTRHSVALAFSKINDDLQMAFLSDKKFFGPEKTYLTGFKGNDSSLNFSTMSNVHFVKNHKDTDQIQVGYSLVKNEDDSFDFLRRSTDYLTDNLESGGKSFVLINNVKDFELQYYDSDKKEWKEEWDDESVIALGRLPRMVKFKITVYGNKSEDNNERREFYYEKIIPIEMYSTRITF